MVLHPLPVSDGPSPFSGVGVVFGHALVAPLRLLVLVSSDARSHIPDTFASSSTPISGGWMVLAPGFSCALPWVRPSRFPCWLLARDT